MKRGRFIQSCVMAGAGMGILGGSVFSLAGARSSSGRGLLAGQDPPAGAQHTVTLLHTNDTHSRIDPIPVYAAEHAGRGGVARRAALIREIRSRQPDTLLVDAGDVFHGTPAFERYGGSLDLKVMEQMGYDAVNIGEHELIRGADDFMEAAEGTGLRFVSANYDLGTTGMSYRVQELITRTVGGIRFGIFGVGVDFRPFVPQQHRRGLDWREPYEIASQTARSLRLAHRCDAVICLSHLGFEQDGEAPDDVGLAREVDGIDVIVGGHSHRFMKQPERVQRPDGRPTFITQAGHSGIELGRMDLHFTGERVVAGIDGALLPVA